VSPNPLLEDGNKSSFQNVVFLILFRIPDYSDGLLSPEPSRIYLYFLTKLELGSMPGFLHAEAMISINRTWNYRVFFYFVHHPAF
jgi:hypothetical protein